MKKFKAILFDMDGVLIDSMPYHFISWFEALKKFNVRVGPIDIYEKEGEKWDKCVEYFFGRDKVKLNNKIMKEVFALRDKIFNKYFTPYMFDGIGNIVKKLKKEGYFIAIVTGSNKYEAVKMLPKNIFNSFDAIVSGDMVKRGKPFPDSYLLAAEKLGVKPSECMVVENAPYGIKAAKAAKMYCVAVTTSLPKDCLKQADKIYGNIKKVFNIKRKPFF